MHILVLKLGDNPIWYDYMGRSVDQAVLTVYVMEILGGLKWWTQRKKLYLRILDIRGVTLFYIPGVGGGSGLVKVNETIEQLKYVRIMLIYLSIYLSIVYARRDMSDCIDYRFYKRASIHEKNQHLKSNQIGPSVSVE